MPAFVPAWKKLGLQLKNAPPASEESETVKPTYASTSPHVTKKRKANDGDDAIPSITKNDEAQPTTTPQKRAKITFQEDSSSPTEPVIPKTPASTKKAEQKTPKSILKKTKKAESDTVPSPNGGASADAQAEAEADITVPTQPPKTKAEKKAKRAARLSSQSNATPTSESAENEERPQLVYLQTYHDTPESWKFNKNHQIQLLKDVFNLYRIPSSYNDALSSYIKGLQGAAARERLGVLARSIASESSSGDKEDGNESSDKKGEKKIRAQLIVEALESGKEKETPASAVSTQAATAEAEPKKKKSRGRKRRVEVESESSSSSESSDSSDSDVDA